jgi:hypothetical protein
MEELSAAPEDEDETEAAAAAKAMVEGARDAASDETRRSSRLDDFL